MIDGKYKRVIPRDFFNEAKLLNCFGRLCIENDGSLRFSETGEPFEIVQDQSDGSLYIQNYSVWVKNRPLNLGTPYNSKEKYPLYLDGEIPVFYESGAFTEEFKSKIKEILE